MAAAAATRGRRELFRPLRLGQLRADFLSPLAAHLRLHPNYQVVLNTRTSSEHPCTHTRVHLQSFSNLPLAVGICCLHTNMCLLNMQMRWRAMISDKTGCSGLVGACQIGGWPNLGGSGGVGRGGCASQMNREMDGWVGCIHKNRNSATWQRTEVTGLMGRDSRGTHRIRCEP